MPPRSGAAPEPAASSPEHLAGEVVRLTFYNPESGHAVATVQTATQTFTVVGKLPNVQPGEAVPQCRVFEPVDSSPTVAPQASPQRVPEVFLIACIPRCCVIEMKFEPLSCFLTLLSRKQLVWLLVLGF